jgi:hypothetical protein
LRRLLSHRPEAEADVRPTLLGIVTLLFLLLFFLLTTSTGQRLAVIDLILGSATDPVPLPHTGLVQDLGVAVAGGASPLTARARPTALPPPPPAGEPRPVAPPPAADGRVDLGALARAVAQVKDIDPARESARLAPDDELSTAELMRVMDVLRGTASDPAFPDLSLEGT